MPVLHCAKCGSRLDISKSGDIWTTYCRNCDVEISIKGRGKTLFDAYDAFSTAILSKESPPKSRGRRRSSQTTGRTRKSTRGKTGFSRVEPLSVIKEKIQEGGGDFDNLPEALSNLIGSGRDYLVRYKYMQATDAEYGATLDDIQIPSRLREVLKSKGINQLYKFQEVAYRAISDGENVVIAAPTGQGKTEAFILPILTRLVRDIQDSLMNPGVRALVIYPTKALARDQYEKIASMCKASGLTVGIFDGDVSQSQRKKLYERPPDILLTNPDVLHYHLGWIQSRLVPILRTVKFVVLDEIHLYTGSMGTNVYYILKRLELETGPFQKIGASATVANPKEFAELLFDDEVHLIESTTARRGPIHFLMYYPGERSKYSMIVDIVRNLLRGGFKTLVFGNTHSEAELINIMLRQQKIKSMVHRAGLSRKYRTTVEDAFRKGKLPVIVSTPTLELGIDIGDLDSVVSMIVSITRLTQRIGRAGRKGQESVAVLALREKDPISSFYRHKPDKYFTDIDAAYMEPDNEVVGYYQLIAAAMSGRLNTSMYPRREKIFEALEADGIISIDADGVVRIVDMDEARKRWRKYSIRGIGDTVEIQWDGKVIGTRSMPMAAQELHPGAIYLHGGESYLSTEFKYRPGYGRATVKRLPGSRYYTKPLYDLMPRIVEIHETQKILGMKVLYCTIELTQTVTGYIKHEIGTGVKISREDLPYMLVYKYKTRGLAFRAPRPTDAIASYIQMDKTKIDGPILGVPELAGGAFHALEHVIIESSDMLTGGGTREIGGISMGDSGIVFVFDAAPGGSGASKLLFSRLPEAFARAETILSKCDCKTVDGCPLCTYSYQCGNNNEPLFKLGALDSVRQILKGVETSIESESHLGHEPLV